MKRNLFLSALLGASLVFSGCGIGTTGTLPSGTTTNNATTSVLTSAGTTVLGTLMSTLLGNTTSKNSIVGTWTYAKPKVAFESENILAQIGASVASDKIESTLGNQLKRIGMQAGKTSITFNSDGTCAMTRNGKSFPGTYSYDTSSGVMTIQGAFGLTTVRPYVSVVGTELYMLFDSSKLLSVMNGLMSSTSYTNTLSSLLGNYNGLKLGWTMTR